MKHTDPPSPEVSIHVQHEGKNKFKIRTDQLEQIGALLRGRHSIFHSVILPLLVGGSIFTYIFQYVSWSNSVSVQHATEVATHAARTYEKAGAALSTRYNAMIEFVPSLRSVVNAKIKEMEASIKWGKQPQSGTVDVGTSAGSTGETQETFLRKFDLNIKQQHFASYYEQSTLWKENYSRLLSEIEITLDRPVFSQAKEGERIPITPALLTKINCASNSLTEEFKKLQINPNNLRVRFSAINHCFVRPGDILDGKLAEAISGNSSTFDQVAEDQIKANLDLILDHSNVFRCYALSRVDYYNTEKELTILTPWSVWHWLTDSHPGKVRAGEHFHDTVSNKCK